MQIVGRRKSEIWSAMFADKTAPVYLASYEEYILKKKMKPAGLLTH